jgi:small subunit ribosomal protein S20e
MSSYQKGDKGDQGEAPKTHRIRITLTSRKVQALEKVCTELLERAKTKDLRVKGPVRLPTKVLKIMTRKVRNYNPSPSITLTGARTNQRSRRNVLDCEIVCPMELYPRILVYGSFLRAQYSTQYRF